MTHKYSWKKKLLKLAAVCFLGVSLVATAGTLVAEESFEEDSFEDAFAEQENSPSGSPEDAMAWTGFLELEQGAHVGEKSLQEREWIMSNQRFRLATSLNNDLGAFYLKVDFINDDITKTSQIDIREGRVVLTPAEIIDISVGKQVNTWGVADMLFINDLFPKNWVSNFLGRDMESMKDSANSMRVTTYLGNFALDLVYHPDFASDTTPTGCRFSVYDPNSGSLITDQDSCGESNSTGGHSDEYYTGELAGRLKLQIDTYELALYAYDGFFKNPKGLQWLDSSGTATGNTDLVGGQLQGYTTLGSYYPRLSVWGASMEGVLGPGIMTLEAGHYNSKEDQKGDNPLIENSKWKYLVGYRMDLSANFSAGLQWYQEKMEKYDAYEAAMLTYFSQNYDYRKKESQNTYTLRLTFKAQQETLWVNLFTYQRPEDKDGFTKLDVSKRLNDHMEFVVGANIFSGTEHYQDREFGMLQNDDNAFARLKYNF